MPNHKLSQNVCLQKIHLTFIRKHAGKQKVAIIIYMMMVPQTYHGKLI